METLLKIKELVEKMSVDTEKVFKNGNKSASIRARKNAQLIKSLISTYRKEIIDELKNHNAGD
jgi:hypothetical protein